MPRLLPLLFSSAATLLAASAIAEPDWSKVRGKEIPMFYPGPAGYEWVMSKTEHTGATKLAEKKQNCFDCHEEDADVIGKDMVNGKPVGKLKKAIDSEVPPGRRGTYQMSVKAAHDDGKLFLRFEWEAGAPDGGAKNDPNNEIKLSVMFGGKSADGVEMNGCWMSCHQDLRSMPETNARAPKHAKAKEYGWQDGVTKYLPVSRTTLSYDEKPRGGWSKFQPTDELKRALADGRFLDLIQYRSGGEPAIDGYVLESRHMEGGKSLLKATGERVGNKWVVTFERLLKGAGVGDHTIEAGEPITFGVSVHENHSSARFHHVSMGYTLGLDDKESFINAVAANAPAAATAKAAP